MIMTSIDKDTFFKMIFHVENQMVNMDNNFTRRVFEEDQELELRLFRAIKNLLKNDSALTEQVCEEIRQLDD